MASTLFVGEIGEPSAGAGLWYLAEQTFGQQAASIGANGLLFLRTPPWAPYGIGGKLKLRRVYVPLAYSGRVTIAVTPIVDFDRRLPTITQGFARPAKRKVRILDVPAAAEATIIQAEVAVLDCDGRVEIFTPRYAHDPVSDAGAEAAGSD